MIVIDKDLLRYFAAKDECERCGKRVPGGVGHPHHVVCRGMGGGSRLDTALNLVGICFDCHQWAHHKPQDAREELTKLIARREGLQPLEVVAAIANLLSRGVTL